MGFAHWQEALTFILWFSTIIALPCFGVAVIGTRMVNDMGNFPTKAAQIEQIPEVKFVHVEVQRPPPPQQKVPSPMVSAAMSWKLLATALMMLRGMMNWPPGSSPMREPRALLRLHGGHQRGLLVRR